MQNIVAVHEQTARSPGNNIHRRVPPDYLQPVEDEERIEVKYNQTGP